MIIKTILWILALLVGFVLLVKGADFFVDGAAGIAKKLKVSTFIIGLTVVALGTSAPEAAVSIVGAISGSGEIIVGNVLGSNIINILLILGLSAVICNIPVEKSSRLVELPFLIFISLLFVGLGFLGNNFTWWEGLILLSLYFAFMAYTIIVAIKQAKSGNAPEEEEEAPKDRKEARNKLVAMMYAAQDKCDQLKNKVWFLIVITIVGLGMVVGGAQLVVDSAKFIAGELFHIDERVVALTVVAFGTSLPELVTSVSAARKGDTGLATGNIIGSNIANLLFVGGLGFLCSPITIPVANSVSIDGLVGLFAALLLFAFSLGKNHRLAKTAGFTMLGVLLVYYVYLFLSVFGVIVL